MKKDLFCSFCGRKLEPLLVGSETVYQYYADYPTGVVASAFDKKTGKRNFCVKWTCPAWEEVRWWQFPSDHDNFTEEKVVHTPYPKPPPKNIKNIWDLRMIFIDHFCYKGHCKWNDFWMYR